jgi:hypothetical protein
VRSNPGDDLSKRPLPIGCTGGGATHSSVAVPDIAAKVRMIKWAGVFDYIERTPPDDELHELAALSERYDLPVRAGGWYYRLGQDEALFERNIEKARILGSLIHNVQVFTDHTDGHRLSDGEVAEFYLRTNDFALRRGVTPCFEVHVNMWSEHFGRVERVAELVRRRGVPFRLTFDVSHVVFKIDNPEELAVQDLTTDVEAGRIELDPRKPNAVTQRWIDAGLVHHGHARGAVPANPRNRRARHPDGSLGRGIQYPFERPSTGALDDDWDERRLAPWKHAMRQLLRYHAQHPDSALGQISCEYIPATDYGEGQAYSMFDNNIACARWLRVEWERALNSMGGQS